MPVAKIYFHPRIPLVHPQDWYASNRFVVYSGRSKEEHIVEESDFAHVCVNGIKKFFLIPSDTEQLLLCISPRKVTGDGVYKFRLCETKSSLSRRENFESELVRYYLQVWTDWTEKPKWSALPVPTTFNFRQMILKSLKRLDVKMIERKGVPAYTFYGWAEY